LRGTVIGSRRTALAGTEACRNEYTRIAIEILLTERQRPELAAGLRTTASRFYLTREPLVLPRHIQQAAAGLRDGFLLGPLPELRCLLAVVQETRNVGATRARRSKIARHKTLAEGAGQTGRLTPWDAPDLAGDAVNEVPRKVRNIPLALFFNSSNLVVNQL
jgi:hypothetical protein